MRDEIRDVFFELKFKEHASANGTFYISGDKNKKTFWFVTDTDLMRILKDQGEFYQQCKELTTDKALNKNCNLLILHKIQDEFRETSRRELLKIEEDPYHFRKYVLYYTETELDELRNLLGEQKLLPYIRENVVNTETFEKFKNKLEKYSGLSLMYRIFIKLPFLNIESNYSNGLKNLGKVIGKSIENINATIVHNRLFNNFNNYSTEDISNMDPEEVLSILEMGENVDEY